MLSKLINLMVSLCIISCGMPRKNNIEGKRCAEKFLINEQGIESVSLSEHIHNKESLERLFQCNAIEEVIAEQDGPSIKAINVLEGNEVAAIIEMDEKDSTKVARALFLSPKFYDQYGLKVGDKFTDIKRNRGQTEWVTDFDQTTYVYINNSKIVYSILGDFNVEDQADPERPTFSEDQIKDWVIDRIEWVNR
jgi:hypothetical protein